MFSISHSRVTRMSSGSNRKSHCGTENCERCQIEDIVAPPRASRLEFHSRETGMIDFLQLPGPKQGVIPCSLAINRNPDAD
jgi:hypothetical protein